MSKKNEAPTTQEQSIETPAPVAAVEAPKPTLGRVVLYRQTSPHVEECIDRAAIIAEVRDNGEVDLAILDSPRVTFRPAKYSEGQEKGTWRWPPRV